MKPWFDAAKPRFGGTKSQHDGPSPEVGCTQPTHRPTTTQKAERTRQLGSSCLASFSQRIGKNLRTRCLTECHSGQPLHLHAQQCQRNGCDNCSSTASTSSASTGQKNPILSKETLAMATEKTAAEEDRKQSQYGRLGYRYRSAKRNRQGGIGTSTVGVIGGVVPEGI